MPTCYSASNQAFSDAAHAVAQVIVYPKLFSCEADKISFERVSVSDGGEKAILDGQMAVDRIVRVTVSGLRGPLDHIVQERFRRAQFASFKDITITEWNHATNQKSELYKLKAGIFLYGYFDEAKGSFSEAIAVNTSALMHAITVGKLSHATAENPRTLQTFLCLKFDDLHNAGVVMGHWRQ